jgi:hypothetical protein
MERAQKETVWPDLMYNLGIETKRLSKTAKHFGVINLRAEVRNMTSLIFHFIVLFGALVTV